MIQNLRRHALLASVTLFAAIFSFGQDANQAPPASAPPAGEHHTMPKPVNLQVLAKDIQPVELISIMRQYTGQLGVECSYCHAPDPQTHRLNFASDDKMEKTSARVMIAMTQDINQKYVSKLPGADRTVNCGTCHRGMPVPPLFNPAPEKNDHPAPPK